MKTEEAMKILKIYKRELSRQQYRTIKGQILSGNIEGAIKGLRKIIKREIDYPERRSHHVS